MKISIKQIDLLTEAIINAVEFDSTEDAKECATDIIAEYLKLLQDEIKDSKLLTVDKLLKTMNGK